MKFVPHYAGKFGNWKIDFEHIDMENLSQSDLAMFLHDLFINKWA